MTKRVLIKGGLSPICRVSKPGIDVVSAVADDFMLDLGARQLSPYMKGSFTSVPRSSINGVPCWFLDITHGLGYVPFFAYDAQVISADGLSGNPILAAINASRLRFTIGGAPVGVGLNTAQNTSVTGDYSVLPVSWAIYRTPINP